jgi:hypothetical protein
MTPAIACVHHDGRGVIGHMPSDVSVSLEGSLRIAAGGSGLGASVVSMVGEEWGVDGET